MFSSARYFDRGFYKKRFLRSLITKRNRIEGKRINGRKKYVYQITILPVVSCFGVYNRMPTQNSDFELSNLYTQST